MYSFLITTLTFALNIINNNKYKCTKDKWQLRFLNFLNTHYVFIYYAMSTETI